MIHSILLINQACLGCMGVPSLFEFSGLVKEITVIVGFEISSPWHNSSTPYSVNGGNFKNFGSVIVSFTSYLILPLASLLSYQMCQRTKVGNPCCLRSS